MTRGKRLGRGLEALLSVSGDAAPKQQESLTPQSLPAAAQPAMGPVDARPASEGSQQSPVAASSPAIDTGEAADMIQLNVNLIDENPFQPRREFNESEIASLSASLKEHDMLQPVLVRRMGQRYQLISGERRLRAAIRAGWGRIPARIREADDRLVAELAIVENLQRKDLNPIEKALSFRRYIDEHQCTQEDLARRLKIDRSTLTNLMRLLELPNLVQDSLRQGLVTAGHARALLPLGEPDLQVKFCDRIQKEQLNVRQVEQMVSDYIRREDAPTEAARTRTQKHPQVEALQQQMKMNLGTRVDINVNKRGAGKIVVHFQNPREFERLQRLMGSAGQLEQDAA